MIESYRLALILLVLVVISAFAVIYSSHSARVSFISLQDLLKESQEYEVEWGQLLIEKSAESSYSRLEKEAEKKLNMVTPGVEQIVVIKEGESQ